MAAVLIFFFRLCPEEPEIWDLPGRSETPADIFCHNVRVRMRRIDDRQRMLTGVQILHFLRCKPADPHLDERRLRHHLAPVFTRDGHERADTPLREALRKEPSLCGSAEDQNSIHSFPSYESHSRAA